MSDRDSSGKFLPGVSGNPGGRKKGPSITRVARLLLEDDPEMWACVREIDAGAPEGKHEKLKIAVALVRKAKTDMAALKELLDRVDGKLAPVYTLPDDDDKTQIIRPVLYVAPESPEQVAGLVELLDAAGPVPEGWSARPAPAPQAPDPADARGDVQPSSTTPDPSEPLIVLVEVAPGVPSAPSRNRK
jgi:hypothetical protein